MGKLEQKIAVVTGGSSGIGLATARLFVEEGAFVFITGRRQEELDKAVAAIGRNVIAVRGDVTRLDDIAHLYDVVRREKGALDIVFANAGAGAFAPLGNISEQDFDDGIALNLKGVVFTVQGALPLLRDGGSIILAGSISGAKGIPGMTVYGAAKAAVRSLARTWTQELKERRIRTNLVSPGPILTPPLEAAPADVVATFTSAVPMGRLGRPEEIAPVALFLASDDASFVTGVELFADGGLAQV